MPQKKQSLSSLRSYSPPQNATTLYEVPLSVYYQHRETNLVHHSKISETSSFPSNLVVLSLEIF